MSVPEEYLFLSAKGSTAAIKEDIQNLGGFFNGIGYAFPYHRKCKVEELIKNLHEAQLLKIPLDEGQTFESFRQAHKSSFFQKKIFEKEMEIATFSEKYPLVHVGFERLPDHLKEEFQKLKEDLEKLYQNFEWSRGIEKTLLEKKTPSPLSVKFISELNEDYFIKNPAIKPRLLFIEGENGVKMDFLHKEIVAMIVAEGGRGKTHLLAMLAMCVASGIPFLEIFQIENPGAVAFVVGENDHKDIQRLLVKIYLHLKNVLKENLERTDGKGFALRYQDPLKMISKNIAPISVHGLNASFVDKYTHPTDFYENLLEQLKKNEPEEGFQLIILDPASRFAGPDAEKDNAVATAFISQLERISEELKGRPTILLSHHKSKSGARSDSPSQTDARGASGLTDGVRWQANLSKGNDEDHTISIFEVTKTNFTLYPQKVVLHKNDKGIPVFKRWGKGKKLGKNPYKKEEDFQIDQFKLGD